SVPRCGAALVRCPSPRPAPTPPRRFTRSPSRWPAATAWTCRAWPPQHVDGVLSLGDLVISVCDRAHEELTTPIDIHWSVPDPVAAGDAEAFDEALADLTRRVTTLAPRPSPTHRRTPPHPIVPAFCSAAPPLPSF